MAVVASFGGWLTRGAGFAPIVRPPAGAVRAQAAETVAIDLLGTLQAACGGDLHKLKRIVKVMSLVNSSSSFTEHHLVTNGCSELLVNILGEAGAHARSAFGVAQLPMGACVEIEVIAELHPG
jgi:enamine deaminase RidA (YjgF/YER057c/UK114 family)